MIQKNLQAQLDDLEARMRALEDRIAAAEEAARRARMD